jgi:hypothetical protein
VVPVWVETSGASGLTLRSARLRRTWVYFDGIAFFDDLRFSANLTVSVAIASTSASKMLDVVCSSISYGLILGARVRLADEAEEWSCRGDFSLERVWLTPCMFRVALVKL